MSAEVGNPSDDRGMQEQNINLQRAALFRDLQAGQAGTHEEISPPHNHASGDSPLSGLSTSNTPASYQANAALLSEQTGHEGTPNDFAYALQDALVARGFDIGASKPDGLIGPATVASLQAWQQQNPDLHLNNLLAPKTAAQQERPITPNLHELAERDNPFDVPVSQLPMYGGGTLPGEISHTTAAHDVVVVAGIFPEASTNGLTVQNGVVTAKGGHTITPEQIVAALDPQTAQDFRDAIKGANPQDVTADDNDRGIAITGNMQRSGAAAGLG